MLPISLAEQNHPQVLQAMECLSLLEPNYLKLYGKFQRASGDIAGAIESMTRHYEFFPSDITNLLNLAELYVSISEAKAAKVVLDEVLQRQPDNPPAKRLLSELDGIEQ
ncbi:MAG: tetratricopeptide repeat protein [Oceanospirillales bacterium]|nr:tetratricopeptide repeat protein [Oceanospirillales bacterium]